MSLLLAVAAAVQTVPVIAPVVPDPVVITNTVVVDHSSHFFQLAQIVKYLGLGVGLSLIHAVVNNKFGLPRTLNKVLPVLYAALAGVAVVVVDNTGLDWSNWYQVFTQVVTAAVGIYALVTLVTPSSTTVTPVATLPVVESV